ncbi:type II secretion system F family protein [Pelotomaculum isophthalicicum JI]|uniref:Type II secretion system F family protein n=1 Tax=Pelotomaculum isophthalicicum JI TaxID=947010 RepID=A0A9X4H5M0_9FIRM|nr:type II secretion system F family protein [Pelotomaculum isophthalicicum]MDF9409768.1 type II secretion system F family protein [Pelotomaculum isophthalicicum JI]
MPEFSYRAIDVRGQLVTGTLSGESVLYIRQELKSRDLLPVRIESKAGALAFNLPSIKIKREINGAAIGQFCRQLSVITMSGVNLLRGLEIMSAQTPDKQMRSEVSRIHREVQKGRTISEAMADKGSLIPELLTSMVATGEASGSLDNVLRNMADFFEKEHRIKQRIKSASVYPMVMIVMAVGLIAFFFNFLLPQMVNMITSSGGSLPLLTRIVIGISKYTSKYFIVILGALAGLAVLLKMYFKTPVGRLNRDTLILKIPLLGKTLRDVATMRFARTTHILIKSGLPLLQGLDFIKKNVNNALAEKAVDYAIDGLQKGETMADNLAKAKYFDTLAIQMFSIGEETGELEKVLEEMAEFYDKESDAGFTKLLALVEPMMLLIIGSVVSTVIVSVMLPMMDMVSHIKR